MRRRHCLYFFDLVGLHLKWRDVAAFGYILRGDTLPCAKRHLMLASCGNEFQLGKWRRRLAVPKGESVFMSFLVLAASTQASAAAVLLFQYIDPGAGSLLLQLLLGGFAGAVVIARLYWKRVRGWFGREVPSEESASQSPKGSEGGTS